MVMLILVVILQYLSFFKFNTFQIKIVMEGTNSAYPPIVRAKLLQ